MLLPRQQRVTAQSATAICGDKKALCNKWRASNTLTCSAVRKQTQDEMRHDDETIRSTGCGSVGRTTF